VDRSSGRQAEQLVAGPAPAGADRRRRVREVLLDQFPQPSDLEMLLDDALGQVLDQVAEGKNHTEVCFKLVGWLWVDQAGRLRPLLAAATRGRPNSDELKSLLAEVESDLSRAKERRVDRGPERSAAPLLAADTPGPPPPTPPPPGGSAAVRAAVRRFAEAYDKPERQAQLKYLKAHKELHDILHDLQVEEPRVAEAADGRAAGAPVPDDIRMALEQWGEAAARAADNTEFPEAPPDWVADFAAAVEDLTGSDPAKAARAADRLAGLPAAYQGEHDAELVKCARRLRAAELVGLLEGILAAANPATADTADLRKAVVEFRRLCHDLTGLIRDHNLCQKVNDALQAGRGLRGTGATAAVLDDWPDIRGWLGELAEPPPPAVGVSYRVARVMKAARAYEAAPRPTAGDAFDAFDEKFADLFFNTDKDLLKVTNGLPDAAKTLETALERYQ
jgi:hypothetical protein